MRYGKYIAILLALFSQGSFASTLELKVTNNDWYDLGSGPFDIQVLGNQSACVIQSASKPEDSSCGNLISPGSMLGFKSSDHVWVKSRGFAVSHIVATSIPDTTVVSGAVRSVCVTPTITASTYSINQPIGGVLTFPNVFGSMKSGMLHTIVVTAKSVQTASLLFFP